MIAIEEALQRIRDRCEPLPVFSLPAGEALGHVLGEDVFTDEDIPRFNSSAMDGYGIRHQDVRHAAAESPVILTLQATVAAGAVAVEPLSPMKAIRLLTGAPVPLGVEAVVMQERVSAQGETIAVTGPVPEGENIRPRGGEFRAGDLVLPSGLLVTPPVVAMLAAIGRKRVGVHAKPSVAVITTGSELAEPFEALAASQVPDSNSFALAAALECLRVPVTMHSRAPDDRELIRTEFERAIQIADVVVFSGGVSVGDRDFVKEVLAAAGVETVYWRIAIKPGKPNFFGVLGRKLVFGVPGNPVAALLSFHLLVRPALSRLMGLGLPPSWSFPAVLRSELRKKPGRAEYVRARIVVEEGRRFVVPLRGQDSHMMGGLAQASVLVHFPLDMDCLREGALVEVVPLFWNEFY
jgi:molybdopterin molybdotransferase